MIAKPNDDDHVTLQLRGPFSARDCRDAELRGLSRRGQALLAYLAHHPDMRAERGLLADLLWSDRAEEQARASLRQELSVLRRILPDGLLNADRQFVWLDASRLALDEVAGGAFLEGFDLASEGFEDWLREVRASDRDEKTGDAGPAKATGRTRPVLAVLAFEELGIADPDMFADGVVEEISGALSRVNDFHVIARQSTFALRDEQIDPTEAAGRLGADYLVEGTVRRSGDRVRISVQLVSGRRGRLIWSARFDDRLGDLFDLQDRIAAQVAGQLLPNLRAAEIARARTRVPANRNAYELVLTAMPHFWSHRREDNSRALDLLEKALTVAPDYGPALSYKAWVLAQQPSYLWSADPAADRAEALELAQRAARHVSDHSPSLVAIGAAVALVSKDLDWSNSLVDRALVIDPNNAWGWLRRGWNRNYAGQTAEARACFDRAEMLSPLDPFLFNVEFGRGGSFMAEERYEDALGHFRKGLALSPHVTWAHRIIAVANYHLGRMEEAEAAMKLLLASYPDLTVRRFADSVPPTIIETQPGYFDALRRMGLPEG